MIRDKHPGFVTLTYCTSSKSFPGSTSTILLSHSREAVYLDLTFPLCVQILETSALEREKYRDKRLLIFDEKKHGEITEHLKK